MDTYAELARRLENMIRLGTVAEVDHQAVRCRVQSGAILTEWLPFKACRAGTTRDWDPPTDGEQCLVLAPSGELAHAVVLYGFNSDSAPPPSTDPAVCARAYPDGAAIAYDHQTHTLTAQLPSGGSADVAAPAGLRIVGPVSIKGPVDIEGRLDATEDVVAAGISLVEHPHGGVMRGLALSDPPQ